jgi:ribosomal 30S subunit maturation factor RimM
MDDSEKAVKEKKLSSEQRQELIDECFELLEPFYKNQTLTLELFNDGRLGEISDILHEGAMHLIQIFLLKKREEESEHQTQ